MCRKKQNACMNEGIGAGRGNKEKNQRILEKITTMHPLLEKEEAETVRQTIAELLPPEQG